MDAEDIEHVAVLGAGTMGHGIAEVAALAGFDVALRDIKEEFVQAGYEKARWSLEKLVEKEELTTDEADAALERIDPVVDLEAAVSDADVVVESVPEKMDVKKNVYREMSQHVPADAVVATNTSALSVTELSEALERPERFCGMHFFNPPVRMQLVEVVPGASTHDGTVAAAMGLARAMGKTPLEVGHDTPGFVVNRVLVPLLNEAAWLVHDGVATVAEVDSTARYGIGLPNGAFRLADRIGLDVVADVLDYLHEELGAAYEPCPSFHERVQAGALGRKTGAGFYDYDGESDSDIRTDAVREDVERRLLAVMANETAKLVGDDVATPEEVDEALMLGAGFPEGPAKLADRAGLVALYETLAEVQGETGAPRYAPAEELVRRAGGGENFHHEVSEIEAETAFNDISLEIRDRVGHVTLEREHRMNTITAELLDELEEAVDALADDPEVRALLVTGAGEAFSAGADVERIAGSADAIEAVELSRAGQRAFARFEECDMPVVAGITGHCLGGGMELAACADLRVGSHDAEFGMTQHEIGLLPGWGGTQRLPEIVGEGRATELILTAERYSPEELAEYGFLNEVVEADRLEERAFELARDLAAGPPVAQRYTKRAIRAGRESRDAGLEVEAQAFGQLLNTEDLMEGITAFMGERDPEFEGN
ncbi:enoyl-CoA hydratase/isomerase family protein [Halarchaeum sp. CBA1220]|uniref:3-hydroxyacyl-CoA dehydrogenase/enoyl-CoA hydratase family protein n=1 Tax=Halarchaeum sp. CBA1220 TaxID=1853682 RepID=UPI000F3A7FA2|nr:3-hydroxyacyl-CoA dehydrogenase/enoyl-CoA hydratase family protein [Halarchaeum sp. CBA1220]QLC32728.1 enoyl-CoA hydratase/isomerase family protein [Halarchaeum sp. CBA1220]